MGQDEYSCCLPSAPVSTLNRTGSCAQQQAGHWRCYILRVWTFTAYLAIAPGPLPSTLDTPHQCYCITGHVLLANVPCIREAIVTQTSVLPKPVGSEYLPRHSPAFWARSCVVFALCHNLRHFIQLLR